MVGGNIHIFALLQNQRREHFWAPHESLSKMILIMPLKNYINYTVILIIILIISN